MLNLFRFFDDVPFCASSEFQQFPIGEQFFIDSVRSGFKALPPDQQSRSQAEVQGFVGQEATHGRIHSAQAQRDQGIHAWNQSVLSAVSHVPLAASRDRPWWASVDASRTSAR